MAIRTFTIEVRVDHQKDDKDELIKEAVKVAAKNLLSTALLLQDKRPPQIAVTSGDMFESDTEIMLVDAPEDEAPAEDAQPATGAHSSDANTARVAGYTVSDKGDGWRFNDPDGQWGAEAFTTEAQAWEAAFADIKK